MAKKVNTLFINDDAINLVVVEGEQILKFASLRLKPGLVSHGLIVDEQGVAGEIGKLFKLADERVGEVIVGLSGINSLYRIISLPELPEDILSEAVNREAERVIPVPLDEVYLSYQLITTSPGETRIFLAAFPRNMTDAVVRTLQLAGAKPHIMDLAPLALCRTLDEPRALIVNAKLDALDIIVMEDRLPQLIRSLSLPGEATSLPESLPSIIEEIDRTILFYNSSREERLLDSTVPIFVCGDLVRMPESWQSLSGELNCPVSVLSSSLKSPEGFNPSEFMVNIGLALKELNPENAGTNSSLVNFNALPEIYLPKVIPLPSIIALIGVTIGIGLLVYLGFMLHNNMVSNTSLSSEITSIENRVAQEHLAIGELKPQVAAQQALIEPIEARANIFETKFNSLWNGRAAANSEMNNIVSLLPDAVDLEEVNYDSESITIKGKVTKTNAEDDIFAYARNLKSSFSTVIISSMKVSIKAAEDEDEEEEIEGFTFEFLVIRE